MKVLHIAGWDRTIYRFRLDLLDALHKENFETYIAATLTTPVHVQAMEARGHVFHAITVERTVQPFSNVKSVFQLVQLIRQNKFEIVHTHTAMGGVIGRAAAILARTPAILHTTGGWYFHEHMPPRRRQLIVVTERFLARRTDVIFSVNQEDIVTAEKERIKPRRAMVYSGPAGVDAHRFSPTLKPLARGRFHQEWAVPENGVVVGFAGRLVWEKGIREFLEVAAHLKNLCSAPLVFVIAGAGPVLDASRSFAEELGVASDLRWLGHREDMPEIMAAMDVYLFPSHREGLPITVLEAMATEIPVVAFDIRGCRETVISGQTGALVPMADIGGLAEATRTLVESVKLRQVYGHTAREIVVKQYTREAHVDRQLAVYRNIDVWIRPHR